MESNRLVKVSTSDGLFLHGYYSTVEMKKKVVLLIHGFEGNFYENDFVNVLRDKLREKGKAFLSVNTRGNGKDTEFNTIDGKCKRIGARYELLEEAHLDITAWILYLKEEGYEEITLAGHSLGTVKAVRYLSEGELKNDIGKLILISPFDKKSLKNLEREKNIDDLLLTAKKFVEDGKGEELIVLEKIGFVMSYKTLLSWFNQDDFGRMFEFCSKEYDFPVLKKINIPTKIIVGSRDEYFHLSNPAHPEEAMEILLGNIPNSQGKIIENAGHALRGYEDSLADEVGNFV